MYCSAHGVLSNLADLDSETRATLSTLTRGGRSRFREWLQVPAPFGAYAMVLRPATALGPVPNGPIIGWSAVSLREGPPENPSSFGRIGVFIHPDHRRLGHGWLAIISILGAMKRGFIKEPMPDALLYDSRNAPWIRRHILAAGFKVLGAFPRG